jgi:hypothetical protein
MSDFEAWLAFRKGENEVDAPAPCVECGKDSDCYATFDDGAYLCKPCADLDQQDES